ncbi:MAG: dTMP kinase [Planctomycetia bacterium]|nr:dTMP kinase [Planctomycetia bacterium]
MFITLDGCDGAGKTTQIQLLAEWIRSVGRTVTLCRDPGGTLLGEKLRSILLRGWEIPIHPRTEMFLYMTSRSQLVEEVIRPALERGDVVLSDRFVLSNIVYQGYGFGPSEPMGCQPDEIVLDVSVETTLERLRRTGKTPDRLESRGRTFFERIRDGFQREVGHDGTYHMISAEGPVEEVHERIRNVIERNAVLTNG